MLYPIPFVLDQEYIQMLFAEIGYDCDKDYQYIK